MVVGRRGRPTTYAADLNTSCRLGCPRARRGDRLNHMNQIEPTRSGPSLTKRVGAGLVLVVVAALALHFIVSLVLVVFWIVVVVAAIAAVAWALNTLL
jgi:hypothetical protein